MRTKALLLSAALVAAGVATSMAQSNVYSLNIVGYVNINVQSNKFYLLENPLDDGAGNIITNVLPLNGSFDNGNVQTALYKFIGGAIQPVETYFNGFGWYPGTNTIPPGTGFYIFPITNATLTFVGSVELSNSIPLQPGFSLVGSPYPAATNLTALGLTGGASATNPNANPDAVYRYTPGAGLNDISTYFNGYGWYETVNNNPVGGTGGSTNGPTLNVGEGFFYYNANAPFTWNQSFTVN
jgi:hypothetical protein